MIFFGKKRKHKLPKFPAFVRPEFERLCEQLDTDSVKKLGQALRSHFADNSESAEKSDSNFDPDEAKQILSVCEYLLSIYLERNAREQALIAGAVRYAASNDDPFCDHTFASGLVDDKQVINYVLEELDIHDRYLNTY